jgi:hypothetical protein
MGRLRRFRENLVLQGFLAQHALKLGEIPYFLATHETLMPNERVSSTAFNFSPRRQRLRRSTPVTTSTRSNPEAHAYIRHTPISYLCIRVQFNWGYYRLDSHRFEFGN